MSSNKKGCIFCKIALKEDPNSVIVYETETVCVFKDIRPASDFHYLAIPKQHYDNVKSLTADDIPLREHLIFFKSISNMFICIYNILKTDEFILIYQRMFLYDYYFFLIMKYSCQTE